MSNEGILLKRSFYKKKKRRSSSTAELVRRSWWDPDPAAGSIFLRSGHRGMNWWDISGCRDSPALTVTALTNCSLQLLLPTTRARFVFLISLSTVLCRDTDGKDSFKILLMQRSLGRNILQELTAQSQTSPTKSLKSDHFLWSKSSGFPFDVLQLLYFNALQFTSSPYGQMLYLLLQPLTIVAVS